MKLRIFLVRFWRVIRALWNREVNRGVLAGRLLDIDREYKKSVAEWDRELHGASPQIYDYIQGVTGIRAEICGNPRPVGHEWRYTGGSLHEWSLLDIVNGQYVGAIYQHSAEVWRCGFEEFVSRDVAMRYAEQKVGLVEVPIRK